MGFDCDYIEGLKNLANRMRRDILDITYGAGVNGGHIGGAFSCAEIFAVLYGHVLKNNPKKVLAGDRDRFILSKGHVALAHYAILKEAGYLTEEELRSFEHKGSKFSTHEVMYIEKGIEVSNGSLGYGLSVGIGCALAARKKHLEYKTYVLVGDGECNEGTVWEAVMAARRFGLDNLILIVDNNKQSLDGYTSDIMPINDGVKVFEGFGWNVCCVEDGNDVEQLIDAFDNRIEKGKPNVIWANTVKAKGLTEEGKIGWHHVRIDGEMYEKLVKEVMN